MRQRHDRHRMASKSGPVAWFTVNPKSVPQVQELGLHLPAIPQTRYQGDWRSHDVRELLPPLHLPPRGRWHRLAKKRRSPVSPRSIMAEAGLEASASSSSSPGEIRRRHILEELSSRGPRRV